MVSGIGQMSTPFVGIRMMTHHRRVFPRPSRTALFRLARLVMDARLIALIKIHVARAGNVAVDGDVRIVSLLAGWRTFAVGKNSGTFFRKIPSSVLQRAYEPST